MTRTAVDRLVQLLQFRKGHGQSHLVRRSAELWPLYVPTMLDSRRPEPVGGAAFSTATIERAHAAGLVDVGGIDRIDVPERLVAAIVARGDDPASVARIALAPTDREVTALGVIQAGSTEARRRRAESVYDVHFVRSVAGGGTPGPMLCGTERFGPDAPGWGFGGVSGPGVRHRACHACVRAALRLYPALRPAGGSPQAVAMLDVWTGKVSA